MRTAVCVTPPGRSAIGTIEVTGIENLDELLPFFSPAGKKKTLAAYPDGRIIFGHWSNLSGTSEELVVTRISASEIHIHCHGGTAAIAAILETLASVGFDTQKISRAEWDRPLTDLDTELENALLLAPTRQIAWRLLEMQQGLLVSTISTLGKSLVDDPETSIERLRRLRDSYERGKYLTRPIRVALAGPPNVGKSTLNNQILGFDRSIVFDQPGTTRDVVSETTTIDGWSFEFSDTAGIRSSTDAIEAAGVELAHENIKLADMVVWVQSAEETEQSLHRRVLEFRSMSIPSGTKTISVINKVDLLVPDVLERYRGTFSDALFTDAKTGQGIDQVLNVLKQTAIHPELEAGELLLFTERQAKRVDQCISALESNDSQMAKNCLSRLKSEK